MIGFRSGTIAVALVLAACNETATVEPDEVEPTTVEPEPLQQGFRQRPGDSDGFVESTLPPDWRLCTAKSGATPLYDGVAIALQPGGLFLADEQLVAATDDGWLERSAIEAHLIVPLARRMERIVPVLNQDAEVRGEVWSGQANLYLHPDTHIGDLVDVVYTLGRQGFNIYQIAVLPSLSDPTNRVIDMGLTFRPPLFARDSDGLPPAEGTWLIIQLDDEGVHVGHRTQAPNQPMATAWDTLLGWDSEPMTALQLLVEEFVRVTPIPRNMHFSRTEGIHPAVFMASPNLRVELLVEAMVAASGPRCSYADLWGLERGDPRRCHAAERVFEAGR